MRTHERHNRYPQISRRNTVLYLIDVTLSVRSSECDEPVPELLLSLSNSLNDEKREIRTIAIFPYSTFSVRLHNHLFFYGILSSVAFTVDPNMGNPCIIILLDSDLLIELLNKKICSI
jgi:hypothetical protein